MRGYRPDIVAVQEFQSSQQLSSRSASGRGRRLRAAGRLGDVAPVGDHRAQQDDAEHPVLQGPAEGDPVVRLRPVGTKQVVTVISVHNPASVGATSPATGRSRWPWSGRSSPRSGPRAGSCS